MVTGQDRTEWCWLICTTNDGAYQPAFQEECYIPIFLLEYNLRKSRVVLACQLSQHSTTGLSWLCKKYDLIASAQLPTSQLTLL